MLIAYGNKYVLEKSHASGRNRRVWFVKLCARKYSILTRSFC